MLITIKIMPFLSTQSQNQKKNGRFNVSLAKKKIKTGHITASQSW
jgi:hypothetical protein